MLPCVALEHESGQLVALEHRSEAEIEFGTGSLYGAVAGGSVPCKIPIHPPTSTGGILRQAVGLPHDY